MVNVSQEQAVKVQMMEQEANQLNAQLQLIEQNIIEMQELVSALGEIENEDEIMANLGKRIFIPVRIKEKKLVVDVGKGNFVKKSIPDVKKIIEEQISGLMNRKGRIMKGLEELQEQMERLFSEINSVQVKAK